MDKHEEIKAKGKPEWTTLYDHTFQVKQSIEVFAKNTGQDIEKAIMGAIIHDIGKTHPVFQERLKGVKSKQTFRHEISSLFFMPLVKPEWREEVMEMVIAHHKSMYDDRKLKGILDLDDREPNVFEYHLGNWEEWSSDALDILACFGIRTHYISIEEAKVTYEQALDFCEEKLKERGYSEWRGLLMGADHFASAMIDKTEEKLQNLFKKPVLKFFNRQHPLYPLSYYKADSDRSHTLVVASTGAGKTDFLFRRCRERVFYTLPFQASINAMFFRLIRDLQPSNPDLDIRVLHAASSIIDNEDGDQEDIILQKHIGAGIKVLTPYQIAGVAFGSKGYEAMILDLQGCDVVLDEVHTYSGISQAILLKVVSVLKHIGCRLHIGTATMPSLLYNKIKQLLGEKNVLETKLSKEELDQYDRHTTHKINDWNKTPEIIQQAIIDEQKILIVCNRVKRAQEVYGKLSKQYPEVDSLLLHSRFKRRDRKKKERALIGLDESGNPIGKFNTSEKACLVVSTQVVEVSLDISFDLMITECAPLDSLIQRFGRINRKRSKDTLGKTKPVYVLAPPPGNKEAKPYDLDILTRSYEVLPDNGVLHERELQDKIDAVFTDIDFMKIEEYSVFKDSGKWSISPLTNGSAWLVEILEIDSVVCITRDEIEPYMEASYDKRMEMEIPARYHSVKHMGRLEVGSQPFILPAETYDEEIGFSVDALKDYLENKTEIW